MQPGILTLPDNEVHLWFAFPNDIRHPELLSQYHRYLNPEEAHQQQRFHFERHRHQYLITRAVCRVLLSRYVPQVQPQEWCFEKNEYGRPDIAAHHKVPLVFNLSHTNGLIACAVVKHQELGVDVEDIERGGDLVNLADRFFSPGEVADMHKEPADQQIMRFFDYWTLKESYIKARGMGLSIPLDQFTFHVRDNQNFHLTLDPRQDDRPEKWQHMQWYMEPNYKVALTLQRKAGTAYKVVTRRMVPLLSDTPIQPQWLRDNFDKE